MDTDADTKVYHWPGTWNIGSTTIGLANEKSNAVELAHIGQFPIV